MRRSIAHATLATMLLAAGPALGLEPAGLRWQVLPGPEGNGTPPAGQEARAGPIGGSATNGISTLAAEGAASVDYGVALLRAASGYAPGGELLYAPWCTPASGACTAVDAQWIDRIAFRSDEAADGTHGSFTARLTIDGTLAAVLPPDWNYFDTQVRSSWLVTVWIDDALRDRLVVNCYGVVEMACSPSGVRSYFPPGGGQTNTPIAGGSGELELGPYDFTWGEPFTIDVRLQATTVVNRASNATGSPEAEAELANVTMRLVSLYDAGGGAGNPVAIARAAALSLRPWLGVPLPEPASGASVAAAALALAWLRGRPRARA
jgi:hypothetical protein